MVKGRPQIVDSVAYYRGEVARNLLSKMDANGQGAGWNVGLDSEAVWFAPDERGELPFEIANVMVGPLDFLFGAIEHE
jgi:hypothetical protein